MDFNVNKGAVNMMEIIERSARLRWFILSLPVVWRLPEIVEAVRWW